MMADGRQTKAEMNVTPLIDVLLVLLIIFMVISPHEKGLDAAVPQESDAAPAPPEVRDDLVLTVTGEDTVRINQKTVPLADLQDQLAKIHGAAGNHLLFVRAEKGLEFRQVAEVIDIARGAGLTKIALMTQ